MTQSFLVTIEAGAKITPGMVGDALEALDIETFHVKEHLWTCASCGASYNLAEMQRDVSYEDKLRVTHLRCAVCGDEGNFID